MLTALDINTEYSKNKLVSFFQNHFNAMSVLLFFMGASIIAFNVMGYKELFNESKSWFGVTPFGMLIGIAEVAVLVWTSSVIRNLPTASRVLKWAIFPVVIGFWFLCFTGINSYLKNSAYDEVEKLQTAQNQYANNEALLKSINEQIVFVQSDTECNT